MVRTVLPPSRKECEYPISSDTQHKEPPQLLKLGDSVIINAKFDRQTDQKSST